MHVETTCSRDRPFANTRHHTYFSNMAIHASHCTYCNRFSLYILTTPQCQSMIYIARGRYDRRQVISGPEGEARRARGAHLSPAQRGDWSEPHRILSPIWRGSANKREKNPFANIGSANKRGILYCTDILSHMCSDSNQHRKITTYVAQQRNFLTDLVTIHT